LLLKLFTMKGLFISGSGTNVGKTFIASRIIKILNSKFNVVARKPIESDCRKTSDGLTPKDSILLNNACETPEAIDTVCRFKFEACVSGEKASLDRGITVTLDDLVEASKPTHQNDFVVIEGAGGLYSPIAKQLLNSDLAKALNLPLVLVIKDELGAVNQALLCLQAAKNEKLKVLMIVLNQITSNVLENAEAIAQYTHTPIVVFNQDNISEFSNKVEALV